MLDHAKKLAEKIRISGGGRCNFTNIYADDNKFLSQNPHFCKSALRQYSQHDFINLLHAHHIGFHEKKLGQLFCDNSSQDIITMLQKECASARATIRLDQHIGDIQSMDIGFVLEGNFPKITTQSVVVATGGLSIPKIGATGFGYQIAQKFGLAIVPTRPGLVPLTFDAEMLTRCKSLSGLSVEATVHCQQTEFAEGLLFTHRGLSGPSISLSLFRQDGMPLTVNLYWHRLVAALKAGKRQNPKQDVVNCLSHYLPKRLAADICIQLAWSPILPRIMITAWRLVSR